jgi:predicted alpha/beta hydrolase
MTNHPRLFDPAPRAAERIQIQAKGATLSGRIFVPAGRARAVIVLHGAVGVPQTVYRHFAGWLAAERDIACLTYDYRDFGASAFRPMRQARATLTDWGMLDQDAAIRFAEKVFAGVPLWTVGHSLGGAMMPFHNVRRLERAIIIAAGIAHVSDHPWPYQALARQFWQVSGPLATLVAGYMPGSKIGFGSDLPAGVFWQWRRWCTKRGFHLNEVGQDLPNLDPHRHTAPTKFVAIEDDVMVPPRAVWRLMTLFPDVHRQQKVLRPADFGLRAIGHLGAFKRDNRQIWDAIIA